MREVDASWTSKASDITGIAHDTTNQNPDTDLPHADKKIGGEEKARELQSNKRKHEH